MVGYLQIFQKAFVFETSDKRNTNSHETKQKGKEEKKRKEENNRQRKTRVAWVDNIFFPVIDIQSPYSRTLRTPPPIILPSPERVIGVAQILCPNIHDITNRRSQARTSANIDDSIEGSVTSLGVIIRVANKQVKQVTDSNLTCLVRAYA